MDVFTVTKPGGTKDYEFEAYTGLLEEIGVDVANVPGFRNRRRTGVALHLDAEERGRGVCQRVATPHAGWFLARSSIQD